MKKAGLVLVFISSVFIVNAQSKMGDDSDGVKKAKNSKKHDFKVTYVNGDTRDVSSTIDINYCMKTMFLEDKEKEEAIYPAETKYIEVTNKDGFVIKGVPQDSMWIFTMNEGPLTLLSTLPETKVKYAEWIQKNGGNILPYNIVELERAIKDNSTAADYMNKYHKQIKISNTLGYYVAPGLMFAGFFTGPYAIFYEDSKTEIGNEPNYDNKIKTQISLLHFAALAIFPVSLLYHRSAKKQLEKAVLTYNKK